MFCTNKNKKTKILSLVIILVLLGIGLFFINQVYAQADLGVDTVGEQTGLGKTDLKALIGKIIQIFLGFLGAIALCIFLYAGFLYMTAGGSDEKVGKAKKWMINAAIGLAIIFSAYAITTFVINKLSDATGYQDGTYVGDDYGGLNPNVGPVSFIVKSVSPQGDGMPINSSVKIAFSKAVDEATINPNNIKVTKAGQKEIVVTQVEPTSVVESNGNQELILAEISVDDEVWNSGWVACTDVNEEKQIVGNTPMDLAFDVSEVNHEQALTVKMAIEVEVTGDDAIYDVTCGKDIGSIEDNIIIKNGQASNGESTFDIPAACYENSDEVYVRLTRVGQGCAKFDYIFIELENEEYVEGNEEVIPGTFEVVGSEGKKVVFTPTADCQEEVCAGQKCFDKNTQFKVSITPGEIKSITGAYGLSCSFGSKCLTEFSTSEMCDVDAPVVSFQNISNGAKLSQDAEIDVLVESTDDGGVAYIQLYEDDEFYYEQTPQDGTTPKFFETVFTWETYDLELKKYSLKAESGDVNDHIGEKTIQISLLPEYCFDADGVPICNATGDFPECLACDGEACNNDDDCAGKCIKTCQDQQADSCEIDTDCPDGILCQGFCATVPIISDINPEAGGPGNLVSIAGSGFLKYSSGDATGQVLFTDSDGEYIPAALGCDVGSAWQSTQVIVKVPESAVSGPIKIVNFLGEFDTTDDEDGWEGDFTVDVNINYPGLCSVQLEACNPSCDNGVCITCNKGPVNSSVKAIGDNFGDDKDDNDVISFGTYPASFGPGFSWDATEIEAIQVPIMEKGLYNVYVNKGILCTSLETGEVCPEPSKDCHCKEVISNPAKFKIVPSSNLPVIENVEPEDLHFGQIVTVSGMYFGNDVGFVEIHRSINGYSYDWPAGLGCGPGSWSDDQIVIKIPEEALEKVLSLDDVEPYNDEYYIILYTADGLVSEPYNIEMQQGVPSPGLCSVSPNNGPEGTGVDLVGSYLSDDDKYTIKFSATGGPKLVCPEGVEACLPGAGLNCQCTYDPDPGVAVSSVGSWNENLIENAVVPEGAKSGGIFLEATEADDEGKKARSNAVNFNVGSCTPESCDAGEECCGNGICQLQNTCEEEYTYEPTEFMWTMSTGPMPVSLQVLERSCIPAVYAQSPSPYKNTQDACPNGVISATFSLEVEPTSLNSNIVLKRCLNDNGLKCDFNLCSSENNSVVPGVCISRVVKDVNTGTDYLPANLDFQCLNGDVECEPGSEGCSCVGGGQQISMFGLVESLKNNLNDLIAGGVNSGIVYEAGENDYQLFGSTWYQAVVKGGYSGIRTTGTGKDIKFMTGDYKWDFKTLEAPCVPDNLLMTPLVGLIEDLYGNQKYRISGQYDCQEISLVNEDWDWSVIDDPVKVEFEGFACVDYDPYESESGSNKPVCSAEENVYKYIGYYKLTAVEGQETEILYETPPWTPYEIAVEAVPADADLAEMFDVLYKKGYLEVKFQEPKVILHYPDCLESCINTQVGANFNTEMDAGTLNPDNIKLYSCFSADCVSLTAVPLVGDNINYQSVSDFNQGDLEDLIINFDKGEYLLPNTYYRVILSNEITSYSQVALSNLNYSTTAAPDGDCGDHIDNDGDGKVDVSGGYIEGEEGIELNYVCGCYDQAVGDFVGYAELSNDLVCPESEDIVIGCQNLDNGPDIITEVDLLAAIKQNSTYYQSDKQCLSADSFEVGDVGQYDAFSWIFKTKNDPEACTIDNVTIVPGYYISEEYGEKIEYWAVPYSYSNACNPDGQVLNPFNYNWQWASSEPTVAGIINVQLTADSKEFCNDSCLTTGSQANASVCNDGVINSGEECEDGNLENGDGCSDKCLLEPFANCANPGAESTDSDCCGNGVIELTEQCDQGCVYKTADGEACTVDQEGCSCVALGTACTNGCLNAGTAQGFECGNGVVEPGEDADPGASGSEGLSSLCLNTGSIYKLTDPEAGKLCGNAKLEPGEECEAVCEDGVTECIDGGPDCNCSITNNPLCTSSCTWIGFPDCGDSCNKEVSCVSGDPGCNQANEICIGGPSCNSVMNIPCDEGSDGCELINDEYQKQINCEIDKTEGCDGPGTRFVECYLGQDCDAGTGGIKSMDCSQCTSDTDSFEINCLVGADPSCVANPLAEGQTIYGTKTVSCSECNENDVYLWSCQLSESPTCIENSTSVACVASSPDSPNYDPDCSCSGCCGNGERENYPGGIGGIIDKDEECETECRYPGPDGADCDYGSENCVCTLPDYCSNTCLNLGSNYQNGSFCQDNVMSLGEDPECEYDLNCDPEVEDFCPAGSISGAPYTVATVNPYMYDHILDKPDGVHFLFSYNKVTKYLQAVTEITAQMIEDEELKVGDGDLKYRTNDPDLVDKYKNVLPHVEDWKDTPPGGDNACDDGEDNDGDGQTDLADSCCKNSFGNTEAGDCVAACSDGIDNDGDGKCDYGNDVLVANGEVLYCLDENEGILPFDPGCISAGDKNEVDGVDGDTVCNDGEDNDNDGQIDLADSCCNNSAGNSEAGNCITDCSDGIDNDDDGTCDYGNETLVTAGEVSYCIINGEQVKFDTGCSSAGDKDELENSGDDDGDDVYACSDEQDNDGDNLIDYCDPAEGTCSNCDPNCESPTDQDEGGTTPQCSDGFDNDNDTHIDFGNDPDCESCSDNTEETLPLEQCDASAEFDSDLSKPAPGDTNICLNSLLYITLTEQVQLDKDSVKLEYYGDCYNVSSAQGGFIKKTYNKVKQFVKGLFIKVGLAESAWCEVGQSFLATNNLNGNTVVAITPNSPLMPNRDYKITFDNIANNCGQLSDLDMEFRTGYDYCLLDNVAINPQFALVTKPDITTTLYAVPQSGDQPIVSNPGIYDWQWDWQLDDDSLITDKYACTYELVNGDYMCVKNALQPLLNEPLNSQYINVVSNNKNGTTPVMARATITHDEIAEALGDLLGNAEAGTVGEQTAGNAKYQVLLCDNLWEPGAYAPDEEGNNKWGKFKTMIDTGVYHTTYIYEENFNVGLFYCRDFGGPGLDDDLPKIDIGLADFITKKSTPRYGIYFDRNQDYVQVKANNLEFMNTDDAGDQSDWMIEAWVYHQDVAEGKFSRLFYKNLDNDSATDHHAQLMVRQWGTGCVDEGGDVCYWEYGDVPNVNNCQDCQFKRSLTYAIDTGNYPPLVQSTVADPYLLEEGFNHIALSYNGAGVAKLYINGVEADTVQEANLTVDNLNKWPISTGHYGDSDWDNYDDLYIGGLGKTQTASVSFAGYIDEFRIWDSSNKLPELGNIVDPTTEPSLQGLWNFNQDVQDKSFKQDVIEEHCSSNDINSQCLGTEFYHTNLTELAKANGLFIETPGELDWGDLSGDLEHQCNDGLDNDGDGVQDYNADTWFGDPKCKSIEDPWEEPELFEQYFFIRVDDDLNPSTGQPYPTNDHVADAISLRIYENSENLPPDIWYQKYAPNAGNANPVQVDCQTDDYGTFCYPAVQDGPTVYVAASNLAPTVEGEKTKIYNNIYVLGHSLGSNEATMNIYSQLVNLLWFNTDLVTDSGVQPEKVKLIRDSQRIMDMILMRQYVKLYKQGHNGQVPQLDSGTYVRGRVFSVWPSWQNEFSSAIQQVMPIDPLNHFKWEKASKANTGVKCPDPQFVEPGDLAYQCPNPIGGSPGDYQCKIPALFCVQCPNGYDPNTCYNSETQKFFNFYDADPGDHHVYSFQVDPMNTGDTSAYNLSFALELDGELYNHIVTPSFDEDDWITEALPADAPDGTLGQCNDGEDNDNNGYADYSEGGGGDPGCDSFNDPLEDFSFCNDGIDNDSDGSCDYAAAGCTCTFLNNYCGTGNSDVNHLPRDESCDSTLDESELEPVQCADGADNDGDGDIDMADLKCSNEFDNSEEDGMSQGNILFAFYVDNSSSMGTNDPGHDHLEIIKAIVLGMDVGETHIDGIDDVKGVEAHYLLEKASDLCSAGKSFCSTVEINKDDFDADYAIEDNTFDGSSSTQAFIDYLDTPGYPYVYKSHNGTPHRISKFVSNVLELVSNNGNFYAGVVYIIITDAKDLDGCTKMTPSESCADDMSRLSVVTSADSMQSPVHLIYIGNLVDPQCKNGTDDDGDGQIDMLDGGCNHPLDAFEGEPSEMNSPGYFSLTDYTYYTQMQAEGNQGIYEKGSIADLQSLLPKIISGITSTGEEVGVPIEEGSIY
ncbi:hypothetical protein HOK15_05455 [Candidatus Falkowbacteria bacterium]|nr:hypothetical protein [Candidatus Falkowbacteria bacterium]